MGNKMYKYKPGEQPSVPSMGSRGDGQGTTLGGFAAIGSALQGAKDSLTNASNAAYKRMEKPGMHRVGKGKYVFNSPEDEAAAIETSHRTVKGLNSVFNSDMNSSPLDRMSNISTPFMGRSIPRMGPKMIQTATGALNGTRRTSVPKMGPVGAVGGAYVGKKLGSWIGSAGKLIGPNHEKYGRKAGEYIGGSVGGVFGGLLAPI